MPRTVVRSGERLGLALCVALLACGCNRSPQYSGVGDVVALDAARRDVTIRHDGIQGLMPAGTVRVSVRSPQLLADLRPGTRVRFTLQQEHNDLVVARIAPVTAGVPGLHDHTPHHGGVVGMDGMIHLEALASPDGRLRVYLSDLWRRPLPLADVSGSVTLQLPEGKRTLPLVVAAEALEANGAPFHDPEVYAHVELTRDGQPVEMNFVLPLARGAPGAVGIPANGCVPPTVGTGAPASLRCTLTFGRPITAIAATPDGNTVLVAVVDRGVSAWRMPAGELAVGFAPPPPIAVPVTEPVHPEAANAVVVNPRGTEAVIALEARLLRYTIASGQVATVISRPGIVRAVEWSPDGTSLLVTAFYDNAAHLVSVEDGSELRRLPIDGEGAAVAFTADGRLAAVGSNTGPIVLFDVATGSRMRQLNGASGAIQALAFVGRRLVSAGDDGVLRVWDATNGTLLHETAPGRLLTRLAVAPGDRLIASAGLDGVVRVYDVARGAIVDTLEWHKAQVLGLTWVGPLLVSGDLEGRLALWDRADRRSEVRAGDHN